MSNVVKQEVVNAMSNQNTNARTLLKDSQSMEAFIGLVHDVIKHGENGKLSKLLAKIGL